MTSNGNITIRIQSTNGTTLRNGDHAIPRPPRKPPMPPNKQK